MVEILTHWCVTQPTTQAPDASGVMQNVVVGAASAPFLVFACPKTPAEAIKSYGYDLTEPFVVMTEISVDNPFQPLFNPAWIVWLFPLSNLNNPIPLRCAGWFKKCDAGDDANHITQWCEREQCPPVQPNVAIPIGHFNEF